MAKKVMGISETVSISQQRPWWNRPLIGEKSLMEIIRDILPKKKEEVPQNSITIYKNSLQELRQIATVAKAIYQEKFSTREFLNFVRINYSVNNNQDEYEGLIHSLNLLRLALETKDCFIKIEATETRYHSFSQQEFYDYIFELLEQEVDQHKFKELVERKLIEVIPKMKTEEGKAALQSYVNQLDILSEDILGLKLLYLFKQYDLSNFSLLRTVAEISDTFYDKDLNNLKEFSVIVRVNADIFLKLGEIIQVPTAKNIPETYALFLQYIALRNRHKNSFGQFQQLINLLKDWLKFYDPILAIRNEYQPDEYKQPPVFKEEIPGLSLYNKYEKYLELV